MVGYAKGELCKWLAMPMVSYANGQLCQWSVNVLTLNAECQICQFVDNFTLKCIKHVVFNLGMIEVYDFRQEYLNVYELSLKKKHC